MVSCLRIIAMSLAAFALLGTEGVAHPLAPSLLEMRETATGVVDVRWKTPLTGVPGAELRPVLPEHCLPSGEPKIRIEPPALLAEWRVDCSARALVGSEIGVAGIAESRADVLLRVELADGRTLSTVLTADRASLIVPERPRRLEVFRAYLELGVEHILTGTDHLLFVLGLLLLIASPHLLLWTLTSFTLGHSVTLSAAALGFLGVPQAAAEAAIAASILVLAVELARGDEGGRSWLRRRPWAVAALFGLLHGLGFAGALAEIGLPAGEVPLALLSFNAGIEIGQIVFVGAVLLLRASAGRLIQRLPSATTLVPAYGIGSLAALWLFERVAAMVG